MFQFSFLFIVFVLGLFAHTRWGEINPNLSHLQYFFKFILLAQQYAEPWKTAYWDVFQTGYECRD